MPIRCLLSATLLLLLAACAAPEPAGDATMPVGPEGVEGDL
jgi:hypothetical protein